MLTFFLYWNDDGGMRMDGVMSQRSAALMYLMWPLPCRRSTCVHTYLLASVHTQECMAVNHEDDMCVCVSGFEDGEKSQRAPGDVAYPMDKDKEREQEREELGTARL